MTNQAKIKIGNPSLDFTLSNSDGEKWHLADKIGRVVALLFYPGNETLVCTKQLCSVRDNWRNYLDTGAEIVGISPGDPQGHQSFAEHHQLPLPLLADPDRAVTRLYGSHLWMPIWATRAVVVIDATGVVRYQNIMVRALRPSDDEVLAAIHLAKYDALAARRTEFSRA